MSTAVFKPLPISSSIRCCAASESSSNGATSNKNNFVKLPLQQPPQPLAMSVVHPGMEFVNVMYFKGSYNAQVRIDTLPRLPIQGLQALILMSFLQVFVGEDEPADSVVRRFRKAVMAAGVIPECRRRRFHETPQDIVKRKQQNARRRKLRCCSLADFVIILYAH